MFPMYVYSLDRSTLLYIISSSAEWVYSLPARATIRTNLTKSGGVNLSYEHYYFTIYPLDGSAEFVIMEPENLRGAPKLKVIPIPDG